MSDDSQRRHVGAETDLVEFHDGAELSCGQFRRHRLERESSSARVDVTSLHVIVGAPGCAWSSALSRAGNDRITMQASSAGGSPCSSPDARRDPGVEKNNEH